MGQLQAFRCRIGAFGRSTNAGNYTASDNVCFCATYGHYAVDLQVVVALTPEACGSECAEKNLAACKSVLNKKRSCLGKNWVEKVVFVRTLLWLEEVLTL